VVNFTPWLLHLVGRIPVPVEQETCVGPSAGVDVFGEVLAFAGILTGS